MSQSEFGAPTDPATEHPLVRFATERPISRSPLANAWLATDSAGGARVLLKQFSSAFSAFIDDREQFARRIGHVDACNDPHLARVHWQGWHADQFYIAFAWDAHDPLDQFVAASQNRMPMAERFALVRAAAQAVGTLHTNGLLHLALTPASFGVAHAADRQVRLIDWGLMLPVDAAEHSEAVFPGVWMDAAPYASAELLASERPCTSDDVYSVSCIAHEVLAGEHPFGRRPARDALALSMPPNAIADLAAPQVNALAEGLALERNARASRVGAIVAAFSMAPPPQSAPAPEQATEPTKAPQHDWRVLATLGLAVIVAFVLVWRSTMPSAPAEPTTRSAAQEGKASARAAVGTPATTQPVTTGRGASNQTRAGEGHSTAIPLAPSGIPGMPVSSAGGKPLEQPVPSDAKAGVAREPGTVPTEPRANDTGSATPAPTGRTESAAAASGATKPGEPSSRSGAADTAMAESKSVGAAQPNAAAGECRHCDCATLEYKRTFTTDPMRPEEQRFLTRNCRR